MRSNVNLEEISDGKVYDWNDLVRADTGGCTGCSACCHDVGDYVQLNPLDVCLLKDHLKMSFQELLETHLVLREENRISLPYLRMVGERNRCTFLGQEDRCTIYAARPDICRLFPLGRVYLENDFQFFLQAEGCGSIKRSKVKVKKWVGQSEPQTYKRFILAWYQVQKALGFRLKFVRDEAEQQALNQMLLVHFYDGKLLPEDFYRHFEAGLSEIKQSLGII